MGLLKVKRNLNENTCLGAVKDGNKYRKIHLLKNELILTEFDDYTKIIGIQRLNRKGGANNEETYSII